MRAGLVWRIIFGITDVTRIVEFAQSSTLYSRECGCNLIISEYLRLLMCTKILRKIVFIYFQRWRGAAVM